MDVGVGTLEMFVLNVLPSNKMIVIESPICIRTEESTASELAPADALAVSDVISGPRNTFTWRGRGCGTLWSSRTPVTKS